MKVESPIKPDYFIVSGTGENKGVYTDLQIALLAAERFSDKGVRNIRITPVARVADITYYDTDSVFIERRLEFDTI